MVILIAYCIGMKEDHQTLLSFAVFDGKWQKRTFSYEVACKKNLWSGQRRGASHRAPSLKYATAYSVDSVSSLNTIASALMNDGINTIHYVTSQIAAFTLHA